MTQVSAVWTGRALRPLAPAHLRKRMIGGDLRRAIEQARAAVEVATERGSVGAVARSVLVFALFNTGQKAEADEHLVALEAALASLSPWDRYTSERALFSFASGDGFERRAASIAAVTEAIGAPSLLASARFYQGSAKVSGSKDGAAAAVFHREGIDLARRAAFDARQLIVAEGYMDVIALAQAGIAHAVAPLGTALTEHQIERLWRLADVPVLCFDGDSAGQKAGLRAALRALPHLAPSRSLAFATLPKGQDPDDVVSKGGPRAMDALIAQPEPLVDLLWRSEVEAAPLRTPEDRAGFRQRLNSHAQAIGHGDVRGQYLAEFRSRFDAQFASQPLARSRSFGNPKFQPERPLSNKTRTIGGGGVAPLFARAILVGLLRHPAMILTCADALSLLLIEDPELDQLRLILLDAAYDGVMLDSDALVPICESAGLGELAASLMDSNGLAFSFTRRQADAEIARRDLGMAIEALAARPALDAALAAATARLAEKWDESGFAEQMRLVEALGDADRRLAALAQGEEE